MSRDRFLELLNLYLDDEIQEHEVDELFAAIESNSEYRTLYNQYCRMTAACSMMNLSKVETKSRRNLSQMVYAIGGLAAAFALFALAARNLEPFFNKSEPVFTIAPVEKQSRPDQVLGPEKVQLVSTETALESRFDNYKYNAQVIPVTHQAADFSWKRGLNLNLASSDYSMNHEMSLILDEKETAEVLSNALQKSLGEEYANSQYSRKAPVRIAVSEEDEVELPKANRLKLASDSKN